MNKTVTYLKEVREEMKNVTWPTRKQAMYFTIAVLLVSVFIAYFLGFWDKVFSFGLNYLLTK